VKNRLVTATPQLLGEISCDARQLVSRDRDLHRGRQAATIAG
jgi:hypothetical protein